MSCCTSFSATSAAPRPDPTRHVNFATGMVLGVDDYRAEFGYLSARDKRMLREAHGYGTLVGLEVVLESDGDAGPRVKVSPGSAAAPSGQLICVGREQCGSINQWLARPEIQAELDAMHAATPAADVLRFPIWLTLCYRDCAVAPVPVPGEPCRSDAELMVPSRIADDYTLAFNFDPPAMAEAEAIALFDAWFSGIALDNASDDDPANLEELVDSASEQLDALFPDPAGAPVVPASLDPIEVHPDLAPGLFNAIKRLWVTRVRPRVMALRCADLGTPGDDCVLLARIDIGAVITPNGWAIGNAPTDSDADAAEARIDQSERPLLLSSAFMQSPAGEDLSASDSGMAIAMLGTDGAVAFSRGLVLVTAEDPVDVTIPAAAARTAGHRLTVRLARASGSSVAPADGTIGGEDTLDMADLAEIRLISNGADNWIVQRRIARGGGNG